MLGGMIVFAYAARLNVLNFQTSEAINTRSKLALIQITFGLNCLAQPIGLALSIYTFIESSRRSIREEFLPALPQNFQP